MGEGRVTCRNRRRQLLGEETEADEKGEKSVMLWKNMKGGTDQSITPGTEKKKKNILN